MREYGQIQCSFWSDPDVQSVSNDAKLIATYLLSGPHSNGLGCYRIPDGYIQADLGMTPQTISKGFAELFGIGFCLRCDATNFVVMPKFLKWNTIANPKVGSAREKEFKTIPDKFSHYSVLCQSILEHGNHLSNGFETVLKGYAIQDPILPDPTKTLTRPDHDPTTMPSKLDDVRVILDHLVAVSGKKFKHVDSNHGPIKARLREGHSVADIIAVIDLKNRDWPPGHKQRQYLRPETLFRASKFNSYVGEIGVETPEQMRERQLEEWASGGSQQNDTIEGEVVR